MYNSIRIMNQQKSMKVSDGESGFVSIIVTMIIMIVLTLIVLGFAQLARREQRSALDRQLSTQAFYAAESGINDVAYDMSHGLINTDPSAGSTDYTKCDPLPPLSSGSLQNNLGTGVSYTCVLYDATPPSTDFTVVQDKVTLSKFNNTDITNFSIFWEGTSGNTVRPAGTLGQFPTNDISSWNSDAGVLRVQLIPRDQLDRNLLRTRTFTGFLYPESGGAGGFGSTDYSNGINNSGVIVGGSCHIGNPEHLCHIEINNVQSFSSAGFAIVMRSIYRDNLVKVCIKTSSADAICTRPIFGSEAMIDVTGKAQDVLRRVQEHIPLGLHDEPILPIGLESIDSICKQIELSPPNVNDKAPGGCSF